MKKIMLRAAALTVALLMVCSAFAGCGKKDENKDDNKGDNAAPDAVAVIESENYGIDNAMLSFFFREAFMNTYQSYLNYFGSEMMAYLGLDPSSPLKDQPFSMGAEEGVETWYDYFLKMAKEQAETCLLYREAADEAGITLDDDDKANVESIIDSIKSSAEEEGVTAEEYIEELLGKGVTEDVLRRCLELETYASKYVESVIDAVDVSDEAVNAVYEQDPVSYETVSYMSYTFRTDDVLPEKEEDDTADTADASAGEEDAMTEEEAMEKIGEYADELAKAASEEEFHDYIYNYVIDVLGEEETAAEQVASYSLVEGAGYSEELDASVWAFGARAGETRVETDEDAGTVTVYLLVSEHARDDSADTRSVRHILFGNDSFDDAEAKSKEVYDKWVEDGAALDDFLKLVEEYSTDPGSSGNGGLYENVPKGYMVEEFENWMFDEDRKNGDHGLIETDFGWHIMYMESVGEPAWMTAIKNELKSRAYSDNLDELKEKYEITCREDDFDVPDIAEPEETAPETVPETSAAPETAVPETGN